MFTDEFMTIIERRFINFITTTITGLKRDIDRKKMRSCLEETPFDEQNRFLQSKIFYHQDEFFKHDPWQLENKTLIDALKTLTPKQLEIITLLLIKDFTEAEAARQLGISQQGVHSIKTKALRKLKKILGGNIIHETFYTDLSSNGPKR